MGCPQARRLAAFGAADVATTKANSHFTKRSARLRGEAAESKWNHLGEPQVIAALGDPEASSGIGAEGWGLWERDPAHRCARLESYRALAEKRKARIGWTFDPQDFW